MKLALILVAGLTTCKPCSAQDLLAQSEPAIQSQLSKVAESLTHSRLDPRKNIAALQAAQSLNGTFAEKTEIVKQVAVYAAGSGEGRPLEAQAILFLLDYPPSIVIRVLAPQLDAENKNVREFVQDWFQSHDSAGSHVPSLKPVNYEDYADYVCQKLGRNEDVPVPFVQYIFERSPERALLVLYRGARVRDVVVPRLKAMNRNLQARQQGETGAVEVPQPPVNEPPKEILLAAHIVDNAIWLQENKFDDQFQTAMPEAKAQLAKLSQYDQWWVRLYVAEIMRRHRELRQVEVLQKLQKDDNASVRKVALSVKG